MVLKGLWRYSRLRFYLRNAAWNYSFWLNCKKQYTEVRYMRRDFFNQELAPVTKKRFVGYLYKGRLYLDNPGPPIAEDEWRAWKNKGLI